MLRARRARSGTCAACARSAWPTVLAAVGSRLRRHRPAARRGARCPTPRSPTARRERRALRRGRCRSLRSRIGSTPSIGSGAGARRARNLGPRRGAHRDARERNAGCCATTTAAGSSRASSTDHYYGWVSSAAARFANGGCCAELRAAGLPVPNPVAAHVHRTGPIYTADIITTYLPDTRKLSAFIAEGTRARPTVGGKIGGMFRAVHDHGVDHPDLTAHNILLDARGDAVPRRFRQRARASRPGAWQRAGVERFNARCARSRSRPARSSTPPRGPSSKQATERGSPRRAARRSAQRLCAATCRESP